MTSAPVAAKPVSDSSASSAPISQDAPTTPPAPRTSPTRIGGQRTPRIGGPTLTPRVSECILTPMPTATRTLSTAEERREAVLQAAEKRLRRARLPRHADDRDRQGRRHLAGLPLPPVPDEERALRRARRAAATSARSRPSPRPPIAPPRRRGAARRDGRGLRRAAARPRRAAAPAADPRRRRRPRGPRGGARGFRASYELVARRSGAADERAAGLVRPRDADERRSPRMRADELDEPWARALTCWD